MRKLYKNLNQSKEILVILMFSNLYKRIITSLLLITMLLIGLYYNDLSWKALVTIFLILCLYEFYNLLNKIHTNKFFIVILISLKSHLEIYLFHYIELNHMHLKKYYVSH